MNTLSCLLSVISANTNNKCLQHQNRVILLLRKIDPIILEELLSESQNQSIKGFITVIDLKPEKKPLKELIKNAYKENKLIRDILTALYKRKGYKVHC